MDEVQTFKALITVHKVLQEGHPVVRIVSRKRASPDSDTNVYADNQRGSRSDLVAGDVFEDSRRRYTRYAASAGISESLL